MKKVLLFATVAMIFASCSKQENPATENSEISFAPKINMEQTKTSMNATSGTVTWKESDVLGIFINHPINANDRQNILYTRGASADTWTTSDTPSYWTKNSETDATIKFFGYYPGVALSESKIVMPAINAQNGDISGQDFLYTSSVETGKTTGQKVALSFNHALALVQLNVKTGNGVTTANLNTIKIAGTDVAIGSAPTFGFDFDTDAITGVTADATSADATRNEILLTTQEGAKALTTTNSTYFMLVNAGTTNRTYTFDYNNTTSGQDINSTVSATPTGILFEAGKRYIYNVTLSNSPVEFSDPTITDWVAGNGTGEEIIPE